MTSTLVISPVHLVNVTINEPNSPVVFVALGIRTVPITGQSQAQYNAAVPMGNPSGTLGDPATNVISTYIPAGGYLPDGVTKATTATVASMPRTCTCP